MLSRANLIQYSPVERAAQGGGAGTVKEQKMKKFVVAMLIVAVLVCVTFLPADELRTRVGAYQTIHTTVTTATETSPATTDFAINSSDQTAAFDLMSLSDSVGGVTVANGMVVNVYATATAEDTCTVEYWGIADGGPLEKICSVAYVFGTAVRTTGVLWADTGVVTDTHTSTVKEGGGTADDVKRVMFDISGFRYVRCFVTARSGATGVTVMARFY
jgi:hypothetical protein